MEETISLKKKSMISTASLFLQSGYSAVLGFIANIVLTIYLSPKIFGIYITVLSIIALLNYFSDIGLAASLIQREKIDDDDVKTAFTMQQIIISSLIILGILLTQPIMKFYGLAYDGKILYWTLLAGFFISSLKTIPSVFLERHLNFHKIVTVQVIENTAFYVTVSLLALSGFGLMSFAWGVLVRAFTGLILMYSLSPWMPRFGISKKSMSHLLSYGVPFQSMSFLALFKDELVTLLLGKLIGFEKLGYIGWAKKWAESTLRIIMDNVSKVVFPLFARIQTDKAKQSTVLNKVLRYQSMIIIPSLLGIALVMPLIVDVLPQYKKWEPALPLFYIFIASSLFTSYLTPFINFFSAIGKIKLSLGFMVFWTVMMWVLVYPLTTLFGIYGFPLTILAIAMTSVFVAMKARTMVPYNFIESTYKYFISGFIMFIVTIMVRYYTTGIQIGLLRIMLVVATGIFSYYLSLLLLFKENLIRDLHAEYHT